MNSTTGPPPAVFAARRITEDDDQEAAAYVFRALGSAARLAILRELLAADEPMRTNDLRARARTPSSVSNHLYVLQAAGLVQSHGRGKQAGWSVVPDALAKVAALLG